MSLRTVLLALVVLPIAACAPPCKQICRKTLFDCSLDSERVALQECVDACTQQEVLYEQWKNQELADLFDDHKRCIGRATCEELAEGVCYEGYEELFVFDLEKELPEATAADTGTTPL